MTRRPSRGRKFVELADLRDKRIRSYVRESSQRQAEADKFGPDIQRGSIKAFCEREGLPEPEREYFDAASGRNVDRRSGLQRALAEAGEYDVLLFYHTSRSFRNRHEAAIWKTNFRRAGAVIVFTEQGIISGDPRFKAVEGMNELFDELVSDSISMFVSQGMRQKFERGGVNGKPPLGYKRYHGEPGDPKNGSLIIDEQGRRTVRAVFDLYFTGQHSIASIAMRLNPMLDEEDKPLHRSRLGQPLTKGSVEEILHNRVYTGITVWAPGTPDEETRPGNHEAIVTEAEWEDAQRIRVRRTHRQGRRSARRPYPLSRPAACYYCGASFVGDTGGRNGSRRYRHHVSVDCLNRRSHSADRLEGQMGQLLSSRLRLPSDWEQLCLQQLAEEQQPGREIERQRQHLERARKKLQQMYTWGDMGEHEYRTQREEIARQLLALPEPRPVILKDMRHGAELLRDVGALWSHPGVSQEQREAFVDELFEKIQLDEIGIRAILPRAEYRDLLAVVQASWGGYGRGGQIRTVDLLVPNQAL